MKKEIQLGLKENRGQFILLVIINAFVGGMIGMERSVLPQLAEEKFGIGLTAAVLSFIVVFGFTKAITNYFTGRLADKFGRKNLLLTGWLIAVPVPFILINAQNWNWIIAANILLGIHQGLAWSVTVIMKIDLVGEKQRGFAMGLNEFAGYISVAAVAFLTGYIAGEYGIMPYPFYTGIVLCFLGLLSTIIFLKDTKHHVAHESVSSTIPRLKKIFRETTWKNKNLGSVTQAGIVNNLNDGMMWGIFPILLAEKNFSITEIGFIVSVYPAVWGIGQLFTGKMSDRFCKKDLLFYGMILQGIAILFLLTAVNFTHFVILSALLGWGTAMVYPTFLATVAENTHPEDRAKSLGIFRFWRDSGYAIGALLTGIIADMFNLNSAVIFVGILTVLSGLVIFYRMKCVDLSALKIKDWFFSKFSSEKKPDHHLPCSSINKKTLLNT